MSVERRAGIIARVVARFGQSVSLGERPCPDVGPIGARDGRVDIEDIAVMVQAFGNRSSVGSCPTGPQ